MRIAEAIAFLDERIRHGIHPGLDRMAALVELLDHPERGYPSVHVTGTNGKYSVAVMVSAILRELGLTVGTYTSPHLEDVRERLAVGGEPIREDEFAAVLDHLRPYIELVESRRGDNVTYFECLTAMALEWFADKAVHAAVFEVGLGGEYDATNVVDGRVAVLTRVSLDHVNEFGGDLGKATWEKAGVIKKGADVLSGITEPGLADIVQERAAARGAERVSVLGRDFGITERAMAIGGQLVRLRGLEAAYDDVFIPLLGEHQASNAAFAVATAEAFIGSALDAGVVREALGSVRAPGRVEVVGRGPLVVLDGGHNPDAAGAVMRTVAEEFAFRRLIVVVGMLEDKLVEDVLARLVPHAERFVVTAPRTDRAAPPERLARGLAEAGVNQSRIDRRDRVVGAVSAALDEAAPEDVVLVFGSFYTVGEARPWLRAVAGRTRS